MARLNRNPQGEEAGDNKVARLPNETAPEAPLPDVSVALINHLNRLFPNTLPPVGSPYSDLERAWGRREVIEHLIRIKDQIEEENHVLRRRIISSSSPDAGTTAAASG
jgi:hypothetical protein